MTDASNTVTQDRQTMIDSHLSSGTLDFWGANAGGACKRFPPAGGAHPNVGRFDWCGEWRHAMPDCGLPRNRGLPCASNGWVHIRKGLEWVRDNTDIEIPPEAWPEDGE